MNAYHRFLDFFSMFNKERLDGLDPSYFVPMTAKERSMSFNYLLKILEKGGSEESVNGIFLADRNLAADAVKNLLEKEVLIDEAKLAAAWNIMQIEKNCELLPVFLQLMQGPDRRLRARAAYYVPVGCSNDELKLSLQGMIRTETDDLPRINAVDKLLKIYGLTKDSVGEKIYKRIYFGLHSENQSDKEAAFKQLESLVINHEP